jgi:glucose-1-phosphate cytidylyltransferase
MRNIELGEELKAVILAGGQGTRLREETEFRPKPMVEVGGRPILWHIMKLLSQQDLNEFVVCLGYKGDQIKDYFLNYQARTNDVKINLGSDEIKPIHSNLHAENWSVTLANTGIATMTGGRIFKIQEYVKNETFLCTYGDGLADIDLSKLVSFHRHHGKIATVTAVRPLSRFGTLNILESGQVSRFAEKPVSENWVSGGFFLFEPTIFRYLNEKSVLEEEPLEELAKDGQLMAYKHEGFWQPMDTFRESQELNQLFVSGKAPWKNW